MGLVMPLICGSAEFVDIKRRALSALPFARWRNSNIQLPAMCLGVSLLLSLSSSGYLPAVSGRRAIPCLRPEDHPLAVAVFWRGRLGLAPICWIFSFLQL